MDTNKVVVLDRRGVIRLAGADGRQFLQGLISGDMNKVSPSRTIYAALLTPQGKYLHDFFVAALGDAFLVDCERARIDDLVTRLGRYRMRARISIEDVSADFLVAAFIGDGAARRFAHGDEPGATRADGGGCIFVDPRLAALGARAILPRDGGADFLISQGAASGGFEDYDRHRMALGVPDGGTDIEVEKSFLVECNLDFLNGIDFRKGCFVGQELTARTKHRGAVRKRLMPVRLEGPAPAPGTPVMAAGKQIGTMRTSAGNHGLALLRLEHLEHAQAAGDGFSAADTVVVPEKPEWMEI